MSKAGATIGIKDCSATAIAVGGVIVRDQTIGYYHVGIAGAWYRAACVVVESTAKSILQTAKGSPIVPELDHKVGDTDIGIGKRSDVLIKREHLVHASTRTSSGLDYGGGIAAAIDGTHYRHRVCDVQSSVGGGEIVGDSRLRERVSPCHQLDGIGASGIVGFANSLTQTARCGVVDVADVVTGSGKRSGYRIVETVYKKCRVRYRHHDRWRGLAIMQCHQA